MKRALIAILLAAASPALAQQGATEIEVEGRALINRWIAAFNRGDADAMAADVHATPDRDALAETFAGLRAESFGRLEAYSAAFCNRDATHGKAMLKFARLYTFGGKMNDDEAKIFDLVKTEQGWRIADETDASYSATLSCD